MEARLQIMLRSGPVGGREVKCGGRGFQGKNRGGARSRASYSARDGRCLKPKTRNQEERGSKEIDAEGRVGRRTRGRRPEAISAVGSGGVMPSMAHSFRLQSGQRAL